MILYIITETENKNENDRHFCFQFQVLLKRMINKSKRYQEYNVNRHKTLYLQIKCFLVTLFYFFVTVVT